MSRTVLYYYPAAGGVGLYAESMATLYGRLKTVKLAAHAWEDAAAVSDILNAIAKSQPDIVHFEIGANQAALYLASRTLLRTHPEIKQIVTLHDLQTIVVHPSGWRLAPGRSPRLLVQKITRQLVEGALSRRQLTRWLKESAIRFVVLRKDGLDGATYLPQPTYAARLTKHRSQPKRPMEFGFLGYWGESKGLTTLLESWKLGVDETQARLTIYGDSFIPGDRFAESFKRQVTDQPGISLGGVPKTTADLVTVIRELDVVVLPYWPENPAGVSAVAMRAAEAGVPIIASQVPQLEEVLGQHATYYDPAKSAAALQVSIHEVMNSYVKAHQRADQLQQKLYKDRSPEAIGSQLNRLIASL